MSKKKYFWGWFSLAVFLLMLLLVSIDYIRWFDQAAFAVFKNFPFLEHFDFIGTELVIGTTSLLLILWLALKERNFTGIIFTVLAIGGGNYVNKFFKAAVGRERPDALHGEEGFSFPSGHAMVGLIFMLVLAFFISKMITSEKGKLIVYVSAILLAILTGFSRIPDEAHYPSDVLAGFLIGFSYYVFCEFVYLKLRAGK
ncbi:phosphatase PAP2 family protein [Bacillus sp. SCS-153A]|uniref:phosphatase PAP2 family protein n=1 Tax=Rossellomorea sedimentorum TaxID=3115294 RepID=UPI0039060A4D